MTVPSAEHIHKGETWWAIHDTRWDVYPQREPQQKAIFNWQGSWLPLPDGRWYLSPVGMIKAAPFTSDADGKWQEVPLARCNGKAVVLQRFIRKPVST